jgi:hypothetical protein
MLAPIRDCWTITGIFPGPSGEVIEVTNINYDSYGMGDPRLIEEFQKLVTELQFHHYSLDHLPTHEHDGVIVSEGTRQIAAITGDLLLAWVFIKSTDLQYLGKVRSSLDTSLTSR